VKAHPFSVLPWKSVKKCGYFLV